MRRRDIGALLLAGLLASCAVPPPRAYVTDTGAKATEQVLIGNNTVGEACTQPQDASGGADIYCGSWLQPSARVRAAGPSGVAGLRALATTSAWRASLDAQFACGDPTSTTILGGQPALLMQCTRRIGGWPQVAMVALVGGNAWYADGVLPVLPVMERSIGVLSGELRADAVPPGSAADTMLADRLAAKSFGSNDIGQYETLVELGTRANLADDPVRAETAFRQALALQEKALGANNPDEATPLTYLALQLSDQGRFAEADQLFARAAQLAPRAADPLAVARLLHYRGLQALNRGQNDTALTLLTQADALYVNDVPPEMLRARPAVAAGVARLVSSLAATLPSQQLLTDPAGRAALLGLIEVRRYRAIALRRLGRIGESDAMLASAAELRRASGTGSGMLAARLDRTTAMTAAAQGEAGVATADLTSAAAGFARVMPDSKPQADTDLLLARQFAGADKTDAALADCRDGIRLLISLKLGTDPDLIAGCLDIYAAEAERNPAQRQAVLADMFAAAQLAEGGITSQQIAEATARLSENARDPRVAQAIRARQDAASRLSQLFREKDALAQSRAPGAPAPDSSAPAISAIDKRIADAQSALADSDAALQAAAPNYGALVQQVVTAADVQHALRPGEAFAAITLDRDGGWVFLVRRDDLAVSRVKGGMSEMTELVRRVRASIESDSDTVPRFDVADAQALYSDTLAGVAGSLAGVTSLTVAPAGPLLSLPFSLLLTGPGDADNLGAAPWLVRKFAIAHVPSAGNFVSLRKVAAGARGSRPWFGFGDFRPIPLAQAERSFPGADCAESGQLLASLPQLPYAGKELQVAQLLLGGSASDTLLGPNFTVAAVEKADLRDYRVLQFATHALLPAELRCQNEPAIVTSAPQGATDASGALLTASDIAGLNLDADLVILSACNSGGPGGSTAGESLSGLARSFFYAGARSLLVTHWSVNDQTAAYLVADTLRRLHENPALGIAASLRGAELAMLDEAGKSLNAAVAHPFYWAPFAVIGESGGTPRPE